MRRIYESSALRRDDDDPHAPRQRDDETKPQALRSVPSGLLSRLFLPHWLRFRATSVAIATPEGPFAVGQPIPFTVTIKNALPVPITLPIESPIPWTWAIDGHRSASRIGDAERPDERRGFRLDRGERKQLTRRWSGSFKIGRREWEPATPGEHTISVGLNVPDPEGSGVYAETTVQIEAPDAHE